MKFRTTRKEIVNGSSDILAIGYCDAYNLLTFCDPIAYNSGVYGWNYDVYSVGNKTICTGYRNMPGRRPNNLSEYERRAREINAKMWEISNEERREQLDALRREFLAQA